MLDKNHPWKSFNQHHTIVKDNCLDPKNNRRILVLTLSSYYTDTLGTIDYINDKLYSSYYGMKHILMDQNLKTIIHKVIVHV